MKKLIILKHGGGELANQLWNYLSIYAYGLETKTPVRNPSFFEYHSFFNFLPNESLTTRLFSQFFKTPRRRSHMINRFGRVKYTTWAKIIATIHSRCIISSENTENKAVYIPPTSPLLPPFAHCDTLYFSGWLFRNPIGLSKFASELRTSFTPHEKIMNRVEYLITPLRSQYSKLIGIHIRQSDYKEFKNGNFIISQSRVRTIVDEYIREKSLDTSRTVFLITSDGPVDVAVFTNLNIYISKENSVTDLFLLSKTDTILGSDSSFGGFASWYGNIPHIIFKNESIDWAYYADKTAFFKNKYTLLISF